MIRVDGNMVWAGFVRHFLFWNCSMAHDLASRTKSEGTRAACSSWVSPLQTLLRSSTDFLIPQIVDSMMLTTIFVQAFSSYLTLATATQVPDLNYNSTSDLFIAPRLTVTFAEDSEPGIAAYNEQTCKLLNPRECCVPINLNNATTTIKFRAHNVVFACFQSGEDRTYHLNPYTHSEGHVGCQAQLVTTYITPEHLSEYSISFLSDQVDGFSGGYFYTRNNTKQEAGVSSNVTLSLRPSLEAARDTIVGRSLAISASSNEDKPFPPAGTVYPSQIRVNDRRYNRLNVLSASN